MLKFFILLVFIFLKFDGKFNGNNRTRTNVSYILFLLFIMLCTMLLHLLYYYFRYTWYLCYNWPLGQTKNNICEWWFDIFAQSYSFLGDQRRLLPFTELKCKVSMLLSHNAIRCSFSTSEIYFLQESCEDQ